jgi:uncharacterized protein YjdB
MAPAAAHNLSAHRGPYSFDLSRNIMALSVRRFAFALFVFLGSLAFHQAALAQDVITLGTVTADGPSVTVPVYIRDVAGTPLGMDHPAPARIQAFSVRVTYAPASAVSSVTFSRSGITQGFNPIFETAPASSGAIALLASFQQATNPIPFHLNAGAPGDEIAHLVFTLSPSAPVGSTITLSLDSATTQLTDEGGTAATKETAGNGGLSLVDGSIHIPVPSLVLTPPSPSVAVGATTTLLVTASEKVLGNTVVSLSSSNTSIATVLPTTTILAGTRSATVDVAGVALGNATITATLPTSAGGASTNVDVAVVEGPPECTTPSSPQLTAPLSALAGTTYSVTWPAVAGATEYIVDEATDPSFTGAVSRNVTTTSTTYSHASAGRFYYRARARSHAGACDTLSAPSTTVSVLITVVVLPETRVLAAVGSTHGANGSFFKTTLQLYNPRTAAISGKIVFHTQGTSGSDADPMLAYSILPGKTLSYADLLPAMGIASGLGSADITADASSFLPIAIARVFNDAGSGGTSGLTLEPLPLDEALKTGKTGVLIAPLDLDKFRLNIGIRTLTDPVDLSITVRNPDGVVVKTLTKSYDPTYFKQVGSGEFLEDFALRGGETISIEVTKGSAYIYGSTTDNITNDPSVQFARPIS